MRNELHGVGSGDVSGSVNYKSSGQHGEWNRKGSDHKKVSPEFSADLNT